MLSGFDICIQFVISTKQNTSHDIKQYKENILEYEQTDTHRQTNSYKDRQIGRLIDSLTNGQTDQWIARQTDRLINGQPDKQTD